MQKSIIQESVKGVAWSAIERFSVQVIQLIINVFLARLVAPSEYGLIALLSIFIIIAQSLVDSGFLNALIQKKIPTETDYSTVFFFNISLALAIYMILFFSAPIIASVYEEPRLEKICRWLGFSVILQGLSIIQIAKLTTNLDFKTQAKASLSAVIISGTLGVTLAYLGYGVWALLVQLLVNNFINTCLLWVFTRWLPKLSFSWISLSSLFSFGSKLLLSGLLHTVYTNLYGLIIGRKYKIVDVGYFNQSSLISRFLSVSLMAIIARAIYPIQCKMQDDEKLLSKSFIQYLRMSCFIIFPIMICMAVLSKPFIKIILTDKWLPMSSMLFLLCISYIFIPIMVINNQILTVRGRSDYFLQSEVIKKIIGLFILFVTIPFGINAICIGILLYNIIDVVVIIWFSKKVVSTGYIQQLRNVIPILGLALFMGFLVHIVISAILNEYLQVLTGLLTGAVVYLGMAKFFRFKEYIFFISIYKRLINIS
jgi:O-antigen/teichoic acid export membrane protein